MVHHFPFRVHIKNGLYHLTTDGSIRYMCETQFYAAQVRATTVFCGALETDVTMPCRNLDSVLVDGYDARVNQQCQLEFFAHTTSNDMSHDDDHHSICDDATGIDL